MTILRRPAGGGWLALIGGGEFSFGDTAEVDRAWLERTPPGPVGFLPTASGSTDYGQHFAEYLSAEFDREAVTIPIYRGRDARRGKNLERIESVSALYLGGGIADELLTVLSDSPALEAMLGVLRRGGVVVAIAAAAQALGRACRSLRGDETLPGLNWLVGGAVEANFSPAHDRRLRALLAQPGVDWGLGLPPGAGVLMGPESQLSTIHLSFTLADAEGDLEPLGDAPAAGDSNS